MQPSANLGDRAVDNLHFIRSTMERATNFTAVPGYALSLIGVSALLAAWLGARALSAEAWLAIWTAEGMAAVMIGMLGMLHKANRSAVSLTSRPAQRFALGLAPPLVAGAALTASAARSGNYEQVPAMWMLLYGAGVVTGGMSSVKPVPAMGVVFMAIGVVTLFLPQSWSHWGLACGFGLVHCIFGIWIARKHGG